jgi:protoporphyrinogen/coproporphyrinogen III oxidase
VQATTHTNAKWSWISDALPAHHHILRLSLGSGAPLAKEALDDAISEGLEILYGVGPGAIRESVTVRWQEGVMAMSPGHRERSVALTERAREAGIDIAGCVVSGNGLLGIATDTLGKERP